MTKLIIPMGSYTVVKRNDPKNVGLEIVSPGAQSCIVVVLRSSQGIALGHIDSPFIVQASLEKMINELKDCGDEKITAELIGGDAGNPLMSSSSIYRRIYSELEKEHIPYRHRNYSLDLTFVLPLLYLTCWYMNILVPESKIIAICALALLAFAGNRVMQHSYDVTVDVGSGKISLVMNDQINTLSILKDIPQLHDWLQKRVAINPQDERNASSLQLQKIKF